MALAQEVEDLTMDSIGLNETNYSDVKMKVVMRRPIGKLADKKKPAKLS